MAFNAAFTISVSTDPSAIILDDVSTGSDPNLTGRTITLFQSDGTKLGDPIPWPLATNPITINPLTKDLALNVVVQWASSSPLSQPPSTYTYNVPYSFVGYSETLYYQVTQKRNNNPNYLKDNNRLYYHMILRDDIDSAQQAISFAQDIASAQVCLNDAQDIIDNQSTYF